MRGLRIRWMLAFRGGWLMVSLVALMTGWAATSAAQTTNSPLFDRSNGADTAPAPSWPAWQGTTDGSGQPAGHRGGYAPYSMQTPGGYSAPYPTVQQPAYPSRNYPGDRAPALRDLTQRPGSPLENAARDAGVRQQIYPAPANGPRY